MTASHNKQNLFFFRFILYNNFLTESDKYYLGA